MRFDFTDVRIDSYTQGSSIDGVLEQFTFSFAKVTHTYSPPPQKTVKLEHEALIHGAIGKSRSRKAK